MGQSRNPGKNSPVRMIAGLIILIAGCLSAETPVRTQDPAAAYQRGLLLFESKDYDGAQASMLEAVKLDPSDPRPYLTLGILAEQVRSDYAEAARNYKLYIGYKGEKKDQAQKWLKRIMTLKYKVSPAGLETVRKALKYYNEAVKDLEARRYELALSKLNDSLALVPYYVDSLYARGLVNYQLQSYLNALRDLEDVNVCDPDYKDISYYLGVMYDLFSSRNTYALANYERYLGQKGIPGERKTVVEALVKNIRQTAQFKSQAFSAIKAGENDKAEEAFKKALEIRPNDIVSLNNIGVFYIKKKDYEEARKYIERARSVNPYDASPYYNLACCYSLKQDKKNALLYFKSGLQYMSDNMKAGALADEDLALIRNEIRSLLNE